MREKSWWARDLKFSKHAAFLCLAGESAMLRCNFSEPRVNFWLTFFTRFSLAVIAAKRSRIARLFLFPYRPILNDSRTILARGRVLALIG
jgi:hypothetical protein